VEPMVRESVNEEISGQALPLATPMAIARNIQTVR